MPSGITIKSSIVMPANLIEASGARGSLRRRNERSQAPSGRQAVHVLQSRSLRSFEFGHVPMRYDILQKLVGIYEATDAGGSGFLVEDPTDISVAVGAGFLYPYTTSVIGTIGLGYGVPNYRLYKRYTALATAHTKDRLITRPQSLPTLKRAAATVVLGASAGNAAINYDTGTVTFVADVSSTVTAVTVGASTQVTLTAALAGLAISDRLYLAGLTGTHAALLNGLSHAITAITGGGLNVYTLSTNTAGKTITAAGSGYKYPQASEALTWSGRFYVPMHYANDILDWELVAGGSESGRLFVGPNVLLEEVWES